VHPVHPESALADELTELSDDDGLLDSEEAELLLD
jgi:hypothetical protein